VIRRDCDLRSAMAPDLCFRWPSGRMEGVPGKEPVRFRSPWEALPPHFRGLFIHGRVWRLAVRPITRWVPRSRPSRAVWTQRAARKGQRTSRRRSLDLIVAEVAAEVDFPALITCRKTGLDKNPSMTDFPSMRFSFRETSIFTRQISGLLTDDEFNALQWALMAYPKSEQDNLTPDQLKFLKSIINTEYP